MSNKSLYTPSLEHDSCGIGFVANLKGKKSHQVILDGITMLENMEHRGGCGCEPETGDGAGIMIQTPHQFLVEECEKIGIALPEYGQYGVGVMFFNPNPQVIAATKQRIEQLLEELGFELLGYRSVPTNNEGLGQSAVETELPCEQIFVKLKNNPGGPDQLERKLFVLQKYTTHSIGSRKNAVPGNDYEFYWCSLSYKTIVYKGQLRTDQLKNYYPDLMDERLVSALAMIHSRFSTNTFPKWKLAQPFRYIAHNGEINTIRGNINWMVSKQRWFKSDLITQEDFEKLLPICDGSHSDSANLDEMIEMLVLGGRSLAHALMMVIPEAWQDNDLMEDPKKAFYEYHSYLMEPWDGPASICFTDGNVIGATLDRNGLRPSRYCLTSDDKLIMASEAGVLPVDESKVILKGRLQPGKIFIADLNQGRIISDEELKNEICTRNPYRQWLDQNKLTLNDLPKAKVKAPCYDEETLLNRQIAFGFTNEDLKIILKPMTKEGKEPVGSMGADIPLPILSDQSQHLANYFKQLFAQVSNPPIDPIRERVIMSLFSSLGRNPNALAETPVHCKQIHLEQPVLTNEVLNTLRHLDYKGFKSRTINALFEADGKPGSLEKGVDQICQEAGQAVKDGVTVLIVSDRDISSNQAAIPSLMATGAIHHHLIKNKMRFSANIVVESGEVRETHHFATLIGYGANAVNPYITFNTIESLVKNGLIDSDIIVEKAFDKYIDAIGNGLLKIFSKMGISTLQSYHGAQIFEILGLSSKVVDKCFVKSISRLEGLSFDSIAREILIRHRQAFPQTPAPGAMLNEGGVYQWKNNGEFHLFNPDTIHLLQKATRSNDLEVYKKYAEKINNQLRQACTLRGLMEFKKGVRNPVPIEEVEPVENIFKRFATGAMSFGSISHEAHSTLAIAMNRIGGKSNSGEGGEDEIRFERKPNGDWERSAIKQVASGRFGVTSYYLANADELQIKMAQGAKPGEGGQLPGHKVDDWIGRVRYSTPGVGLISPPPHHDIYSIEDLAQLIYDLKNSNRKARVNVKLVAEAGVGTIAAGVAKGKADVVLISGHDGGTGASPISSIRHAGLPWELGLAETHQTLVRNKLRSRIVVQTDGQIRTGRDLAIATLLGAEEYGVASAALVVEGCIMMRKCHLNTCPVGVATQNKELRKKFTGKPEYVVNFFTFLAQDLREIMAELGFRTVNEMVGQADMLQLREDIDHWKFKDLDLSPILYREPADPSVGLYRQIDQDHEIEDVLDWQLIKAAEPALENGMTVSSEFKIVNTNRAVGTILSNEISKKFKGEGLPLGSINFKFKGSAGQSFGAFGAHGLKLELEGEANDYFGKGLSGAQLIIYPHQEAQLVPHENQIIGNVSFYGATSGEAYIRGLAGERFCVRNSGVKAVVEGIGDHGCEYMTGGIAVILGDTGRNFAAGMSGGIAYVYDPENRFPEMCNMELVEFDPIEFDDTETLKELINNHHLFTGSEVAEKLINDWGNTLNHFVKVMPGDYKAALMKQKSTLQKAI